MKKYLILLLTLIFCYTANSQEVEKPLTNAEIQKLRDSLSSLPKNPLKINIDGEVYFQSNTSRSVNDGCTGGDFEIPPIEYKFSWPGGATIISQEWNLIDLINTNKPGNWTGFYGDGLINNNSGLMYTADPNHSNHVQAQTYIQWTSSAYRDQTLASANPSFTVPMAFNTGRAIRLGNNHSNDQNGFGRAEGISKTFIVNQSNKIYYFKYAVVGQFSHGEEDSAFFLAEAFNSTGQRIDDYFELGEQNNPFISVTRNTNRNHQGYTSEDRFYYRDWTCASLDLRDYVGQQVTVRFVNSDCAQGGHASHSYIDDVCVPCKDTEGWIDLNIKEDCIKLPNKLTGDFYTPTNQPSIRNIKIKLLFYQNNILKHTFYPTITGSTYSLNLTESMLKNLECYDVVAELSFELQNGYDPTKYISYSKLSSDPLNNSVEGEIEGINNDVCFNCFSSKNCCENPLEIESNYKDNKLPTMPVTMANGNNMSVAGEIFTFKTDATIPITEVRTVITDMDFEYDYEQCAQCIDNPALWGSLMGDIDSIGSTPNALKLDPKPLPMLGDLNKLYNNNINNRELIWKNDKGEMIKSGDDFNVSYLLPPTSEIPCCATSAKICIEISYKDANCKVCTEQICTTINL